MSARPSWLPSCHPRTGVLVVGCDGASVGLDTLCPYSPLSDDHIIQAVRLEYEMKRNFFLDTLAKHVPTDLVSTIPAGGGMFQC